MGAKKLEEVPKLDDYYRYATKPIFNPMPTRDTYFVLIWFEIEA